MPIPGRLAIAPTELRLEEILANYDHIEIRQGEKGGYYMEVWTDDWNVTDYKGPTISNLLKQVPT